jgi:predicted lysophospholipase L1 biosynthesis ABC-type transport system permease subunit
VRVASLFAVEYALGGAVAATIAALGAYGLTLMFTRHVLELQTSPSWLACGVGWIVIVTLSIGAGLLASARALCASPLAVLRD